MECNHRYGGDYVHGMWVCAMCFRPLEERPVKYGMVVRSAESRGEARQEITWQAPIATDSAGTTFGTFLRWMISYLRLRSLWLLSKDDARAECLETLREQGEPFGSLDACWTRPDAHDLVVEGICSYWDEASNGSNA